MASLQQTSGKLISLPAAGLTKLQPAAGSLGASMTTNVSVSANHMSLTSTQQKNMQANSVPDSDIQVTFCSTFKLYKILVIFHKWVTMYLCSHFLVSLFFENSNFSLHYRNIFFNV